MYFIRIKKMLRSVFNKLSLFDVTMSHGINNIGHGSSKLLHNRKTVLHNIFRDYQPSKIEIGTLNANVYVSHIGHVSSGGPLEKPTLSQCDTLQLYNYAKYLQLKTTDPCEIYAVVPINSLYLNKIKPLDLANISINTSVSDTFIKRHTGQTLVRTKKQLSDAFKHKSAYDNVKLYIHCISHCNITGKQDINKVIAEVLYYNTLPGITELCLVDTFGKLQFNDFMFLLDKLKKEMGTKEMKRNGMGTNKLSLRLNNGLDFDEIQTKNRENIIQYCLENNIYKFDVVRGINFPNDAYNILTYDSLYDNFEEEDCIGRSLRG